MPARIRRSIETDDEGFTLIELLVVIIIIGILAAIAIPVFLNQRKKGWDAAAKSDLRSMAGAQESYLVSNGTYTHLLSDLTAEGYTPSPGVGTNAGWVLTSDVNGGATYAYAKLSGAFCMFVRSQSGNYFYYASRGGGLGPGPNWTACRAP